LPLGSASARHGTAQRRIVPKYFTNLISLAQADQSRVPNPPLPPPNTVQGTSSSYNPTKTGFRLYVKTTGSVAQANAWWRINWVAVP